MLALLRGAVEPPAATVTRLAQQACPYGSVSSTFIRPGENCTGYPMSTALVAPVLKAVGGHDAAVTKARTYLRKAQSETGAFLAYEGAPAASVTTTAYAAQALRALGETKAADAAVAWLSREQLDGGGFGSTRGTPSPRCTRRSPPCSRERASTWSRWSRRTPTQPPADHSRSPGDRLRHPSAHAPPAGCGSGPDEGRRLPRRAPRTFCRAATTTTAPGRGGRSSA
ncbi:hypothetical protein SCALM49S_06613 [Streptomyces californicus]